MLLVEQWFRRITRLLQPGPEREQGLLQQYAHAWLHPVYLPAPSGEW
jgi:hypothetical protein